MLRAESQHYGNSYEQQGGINCSRSKSLKNKFKIALTIGWLFDSLILKEGNRLLPFSGAEWDSGDR